MLQENDQQRGGVMKPSELLTPTQKMSFYLTLYRVLFLLRHSTLPRSTILIR